MHNGSFEIKQCVNVLKSTGKKAKDLQELGDCISRVSDASLFHHTYQYFLKGAYLEYTNDFAHWAGVSLEKSALAEQLSNVDPYSFREMSGLRAELLSVINDNLTRFPETREVLRGDEFYFNETVTLVFPAGVRAENLAEFLIGLKYIDPAAIYYHFYDARVRLGGGTDDFSNWVETALGKAQLAERMRAIDPFIHNLEDMREHLVEEVEKQVRTDMEALQ
jgi:hypothetical protein